MIEVKYLIKKNCNGCVMKNPDGDCGLGYDNEAILVEHVLNNNEKIMVRAGFKPSEECPKPRTHKKALTLSYKWENSR